MTSRAANLAVTTILGDIAAPAMTATPSSSKEPAPHRGRLFVFAAPSGAGKTSLVRALMEKESSLRFSVSYTTRQKRATEKKGHDYIFVAPEEFQRLARSGEFLEYAQVFDNWYATPRRQVEEALVKGEDIILEIDWQGAQQVRAAMPECITIFILPPSRAALEQRLRERGTDSDEVIARRLRDAVSDMTHWQEFDYVVINEQFDKAVDELREIVQGRGEALRAGRREVERLIRLLLA
jgi:guanylate kinase